MIQTRRLKPKEVRGRIRDYINEELGEKLELKLCEAGSEFPMSADLKSHLPAVFVRLANWSSSHDSKLGVRRTVYQLEVAYLRALGDDEEAQENLIEPLADLDELFCRDGYMWPFVTDEPDDYKVVSVLSSDADFPEPADLDELDIRLESCSLAVAVTVDTQPRKRTQ